MGGTWDNINNQTTNLLAYSNGNLVQSDDKSGNIRDEGGDRSQPRHIQYPLDLVRKYFPLVHPHNS
jgi:hypothetical protein